ncbi:MAG: GntR family transcriptional regulator [Bryobacter sp.]|jgi:DNA-binding GntR family transcriptional regulator|nr:GntR family transcriptional regulator [Bryobacter sp. CoA8 C33]
MTDEVQPVVPGIADPIYVRVREQIRTDILKGVFSPGDRIKIADIARRYGVSQMPVREALQMLQGEGLITFAPNRGASIRNVDEHFIENMYEIRGALEALLMRRAISRIQDSDIFRLHAIEARYEECARQRDLDGVLRENKAFHHVIYQIADNVDALRLLERNWELVITMRRTFGFGAERLDQLVAEHRALIRALDRRDAAEAERVTLLHCENARQDLLAQREASGIAQSKKARRIR